MERCRRLAAQHLGYAVPNGPPQFGLQAPPPVWKAPDAYAVLIPVVLFYLLADWPALVARVDFLRPAEPGAAPRAPRSRPRSSSSKAA